jgi:thiosulfate/3-mercaptopyruvate sulfurtransferase
MRRTVPMVMLVAAAMFALGCQCGRTTTQTKGSMETTACMQPYGASSGGAIQPMEATPETEVTAAIQKIRRDMVVSTDWLASHLTDKDLAVLDVGPDKTAYETGHIPGALFVSLSDIRSQQGSGAQMPSMDRLVSLTRQLGLDYNNRIVCYSDDGGLAAARMYVVLDYLGLGYKASLLDGQIQKWCQENRQMSKEEPTVTASAFTPIINPDVLVAMPQVWDVAWTASCVSDAPVAVIDARPPDEYSGKVTSQGASCSGHIPGAVNVPWKDNVVSGPAPVLASPDALRKMYADAGVKPGDMVVTYCRTGMASAYTYFVTKYIGYDSHFYDGSIIDWCNAKGEVASGYGNMAM